MSHSLHVYERWGNLWKHHFWRTREHSNVKWQPRPHRRLHGELSPHSTAGGSIRKRTVTSFGNRFFAGGDKLSSQRGVWPWSYDTVPWRRENRHRPTGATRWQRQSPVMQPQPWTPRQGLGQLPQLDRDWQTWPCRHLHRGLWLQNHESTMSAVLSHPLGLHYGSPKTLGARFAIFMIRAKAI